MASRTTVSGHVSPEHGMSCKPALAHIALIIATTLMNLSDMLPEVVTFCELSATYEARVSIQWCLEHKKQYNLGQLNVYHSNQ